jgi:excisionase family DNA binding protein
MVSQLRRLNQRRLHCLTVTEFSVCLGISPATVRDWIKSGKLNALEVSAGNGRKSYRIHRSELTEVFVRCGTLAGRANQKAAIRKKRPLPEVKSFIV